MIVSSTKFELIFSFLRIFILAHWHPCIDKIYVDSSVMILVLSVKSCSGGYKGLFCKFIFYLFLNILLVLQYVNQFCCLRNSTAAALILVFCSSFFLNCYADSAVPKSLG